MKNPPLDAKRPMPSATLKITEVISRIRRFRFPRGGLHSPTGKIISDTQRDCNPKLRCWPNGRKGRITGSGQFQGGTARAENEPFAGFAVKEYCPEKTGKAGRQGICFPGENGREEKITAGAFSAREGDHFLRFRRYRKSSRAKAALHSTPHAVFKTSMPRETGWIQVNIPFRSQMPAASP